MREMALALSMSGRCDEAIELLRPLKALTPPAAVGAVITGQCYAAKGDWPAAIAEFGWAVDWNRAQEAPSFLAYALARGGQRTEAERILTGLLAGRQQSLGPFGIAVANAGLGDFDAAFTWLDKAIDQSRKLLRPYLFGPMFEELRRDPRFAKVRKRMGI